MIFSVDKDQDMKELLIRKNYLMEQLIKMLEFYLRLLISATYNRVATDGPAGNEPLPEFVWDDFVTGAEEEASEDDEDDENDLEDKVLGYDDY